MKSIRNDCIIVYVQLLSARLFTVSPSFARISDSKYLEEHSRVVLLSTSCPSCPPTTHSPTTPTRVLAGRRGQASSWCQIRADSFNHTSDPRQFTSFCHQTCPGIRTAPGFEKPTLGGVCVAAPKCVQRKPQSAQKTTFRRGILGRNIPSTAGIYGVSKEFWPTHLRYREIIGAAVGAVYKARDEANSQYEY